MARAGKQPAVQEEDDISELLERLRSREWRLTAQRRVVAEVLGGERGHLSAEAVHVLASERLPEISRATVYNTLNELVAMGEVEEVTVSGGPRRYDPDVTHPHQHLVCVRCGEMRDVRPQGEDGLRLAGRRRHGYRLLGVDIVFRGLCQPCQGEADAQA